MIERDQAGGCQRAPAWRRFLGLTSVGMALVSCTGSIGETTGTSGTGGPGPSGTSGTQTGTSTTEVGTTTSSTTGATTSTGTTTTIPDPKFVPQASSLRRLTIPQYKNAIRDLLGDAIKVTTEFDDDLPFGGFISIGVANLGVSSKMTEQFESTALDIAKQALTDMTRRTALVGCTPANATDETCTRSFIQKFGRRAWRRPVNATELTRYATVAKNAQTVVNDFYGGLQYALAGLLMSPHFVYREELGGPDPTDATRVVFNDYELATRLSFFLWNTTPDDTLLDAADGRALSQGALLQQAQRLIASPRLGTGVENYFTELYALGDLDNLALNATVYPAMSATLGASMRTETLKFLNDIIFVRNADIREIFESRSTFVNTELAKIYGLSPVAATAGFVNVMLPDTGFRAGFLGQGSFLASPSHSQPDRSSPTLRGKFVREMLLCQSVAPAPMNVPPFPGAIMAPARDKLAAHRTLPACSACHLFMDPIGLGFENLDGIGASRTTEFGKTIDASGDLDGVKFTGARELMAAVKNHPDAPACIARTTYRYALGHVDNDGEAGPITTLVKTLVDSGYKYRSLLEGVVRSPGFVIAAKPVN